MSRGPGSAMRYALAYLQANGEATPMAIAIAIAREAGTYRPIPWTGRAVGYDTRNARRALDHLVARGLAARRHKPTWDGLEETSRWLYRAVEAPR